MTNIIFLDIDGVLNAHTLCPTAQSNGIDREKVHLLNQVILATDAKIVLSSAWRYLVHRGEMSLTGLDWLLRSHGLKAGALIGVTDKDTMINREEWKGTAGREWPMVNERGQQILKWMKLAENAHRDRGFNFIALDDMDLGITEAGVPLVQTDGKVGLTQDDTNKLLTFFRNPQCSI